MLRQKFNELWKLFWNVPECHLDIQCINYLSIDLAKTGAVNKDVVLSLGINPTQALRKGVGNIKPLVILTNWSMVQ